MSDNDYFHEKNPTINLRVWVLGQMVWGAFISSIIVTGIVGTMVAIWALGLLLPEESKQMPSPYGSIEIVQTISVG
jgi:hypothetical protein